MTRPRPRLVLLVVFLTILLGVGCGKAPPDAIAPAVDPPTIQHDGNRLVIPDGSPLRQRLKVEPVKILPVTDKLQVPASVEPDPATTAKITAPVAGRVVKLFVHVGDTVKQGQPLFSLDAPDLVSAQSDYLHARSTLAQAEKTLARQRDLKEHGIGSDRDLEQAQTDEKVARAELERTSMRLKLLKSDPGELGKPLSVLAPIPGRVVDATIAPGEFKNDPNAVLMTITDLSNVWVTANVQEKDVRRVHAGQEVTATFTAYPGETFSGKVLFVADILDPDTRTLKARIAFANDTGRLKPGMFALVTFQSQATPKVVVPAVALVLLGDKNVVFQEVAPWTFEPREVVAGASHEEGVTIEKGLAGGEKIVASDAVLLQ
jgi:membrane fusion protein, heavy metal efflux system